MKRFLSTAIVGVVCFALGVAFQRYYDARRAPAQPPADSTVCDNETGTAQAGRSSSTASRCGRTGSRPSRRPTTKRRRRLRPPETCGRTKIPPSRRGRARPAAAARATRSSTCATATT